jgi:hypothetical protein
LLANQDLVVIFFVGNKEPKNQFIKRTDRTVPFPPAPARRKSPTADDAASGTPLVPWQLSFVN